MSSHAEAAVTTVLRTPTRASYERQNVESKAYDGDSEAKIESEQKLDSIYQQMSIPDVTRTRADTGGSAIRAVSPRMENPSNSDLKSDLKSTKLSIERSAVAFIEEDKSQSVWKRMDNPIEATLTPIPKSVVDPRARVDSIDKTDTVYRAIDPPKPLRSLSQTASAAVVQKGLIPPGSYGELGITPRLNSDDFKGILSEKLSEEAAHQRKIMTQNAAGASTTASTSIKTRKTPPPSTEESKKPGTLEKKGSQFQAARESRNLRVGGRQSGPQCCSIS